MKNKVSRYYNTLRYLKVQQVAAQIKKRLIKSPTPQWKFADKAFSLQTVGIYIPEIDADSYYLKRFNVNEILNGRISLLHKSVSFDACKWHYRECTPLWNYNLHYFEYTIPMAIEFYRTKDIKYVECFQRIYSKWLQTPTQETWQAYTISLRLRNLIIAEYIFGDTLPQDFRKKLNSSIYQQYLFLQHHTEVHLLGNHYFENLCTITLLGLAFGEERIFNQWYLRLKREINEEILPDGMHFERSLMYHKLILEDLLRLASALKVRERKELTELLPTIQKMLSAMCSLEKGCGRTPLFNDCGDNVAKPRESLERACFDLFGIRPTYKNTFEDAGYYKLYAPDISLIVDAGAIGPDYIPGHAHCDCGSFELFWHDMPLFVNCGTGQYQGVKRPYYRSTRAHNTALINGHEQSDCWREHRVGKRIRNVNAKVNDLDLQCSYENYFGERHSRKFTLTNSCLEVSEQVENAGKNAKIKSFLHVAPEFRVLKQAEKIEVFLENKIVCYIKVFGAEISLKTCDYAPEFEMEQEATEIMLCWKKMFCSWKIIFNKAEEL